MAFSVSATTRPPRPGEVDGVHYYFVTKENFEDMIRKGEFLEYDAHAKNYYGTPRGQMEEKLENGSVLLDIEPVGAGQVRKAAPEAVLIFIMPPGAFLTLGFILAGVQKIRNTLADRRRMDESDPNAGEEESK